MNEPDRYNEMIEHGMSIFTGEKSMSNEPIHPEKPYIQFVSSDELKPRTESERKAYLEGVDDGRIYEGRDAAARPARTTLSPLDKNDLTVAYMAGHAKGHDVGRAELAPSRDEQRQLKIGHAVEKVAELLPTDYEIVINLEKGSGTVKLFDPDGKQIECGSDESFQTQIYTAIEVAIELQAMKL